MHKHCCLWRIAGWSRMKPNEDWTMRALQIALLDILGSSTSLVWGAVYAQGRIRGQMQTKKTNRGATLSRKTLPDANGCGYNLSPTSCSSYIHDENCPPIHRNLVKIVPLRVMKPSMPHAPAREDKRSKNPRRVWAAHDSRRTNADPHFSSCDCFGCRHMCTKLKVIKEAHHCLERYRQLKQSNLSIRLVHMKQKQYDVCVFSLTFFYSMSDEKILVVNGTNQRDCAIEFASMALPLESTKKSNSMRTNRAQSVAAEIGVSNVKAPIFNMPKLSK